LPRNTRQSEAPLSKPGAPQRNAVNQAEPVSGAAGQDDDVVREVPPRVAPSAQQTIVGKIKLRVRVRVDHAGDVTKADLVSAGPSKYFARLAMEAAQQWKFAPTTQVGERRWMLHFDFTRIATTSSADRLN